MSLYRLDQIAPRLGQEVWIAPNATLIGDIRLEDRASVWFNAVLRGDNDPICIGPETNIQDGNLVGLAQAGAASGGYVPGPYSPQTEGQVEQFVNWYIRRMAAGLA